MKPSFSRITLPFLLLFITFSSIAQVPALTITSTDPLEKKAVTLRSIDIDVQVTGTIATTTMTMTFYNNSDRILEGTLVFPLPEGTTVSRYAIDINGKLREAVPVEKTKGTEVFEAIEHRRVDPGLLEKVEGNNFRTRIYPIPATGTRTVLIAYEQELKPDSKLALKYFLPLNYQSVIPEFHLKATVFRSGSRPLLEEQPDGSFSFSGNSDVYLAEMNKTNYQPQRSLIIHLPKNNDLSEVILQPAGDSYYFLVNAYPKKQSRPRKWSDKIGIIWDVSLSGIQRDLKKEIDLLDKIIRDKKNCTIELGLLNNRFLKAGTYRISNGNWNILRDKLQNLVYDGGTNFSSIQESILAADEYLFFTDGLSTFGKDTIAISKPVNCITSAITADFSGMKRTSSKTGGQFINLSNTTPDDALKILSNEDLRFIGIKPNQHISEMYPSDNIPTSGSVSLSGITDLYGTEITLQFGYGNEVISEKTVRLKGASGDNIARVWAQKKIAAMDVEYEENKEDITALGKQFGIVTRNTSLIVLETAEDYLRYDIMPPAELRQEYDRLLKDRITEKEQRVNDLLERAFAITDELREWWKTVFQQRKKFPVPQQKLVREENYSVVETVSNAIATPPPPPPQVNQVLFTSPRIVKDEEMKVAEWKTAGTASATLNYSTSLQGRVSGLSISADTTRQDNDGSNTKIINVPEFRSDKDYMKKFIGINSKTAYNTYLSLRKEYEHTPLYYFDIASWFYKQNSRDTALMILSNIADLGLEDAELYKLLAYKLKQQNEYEAELFVTGKVLQWRPMDPQSFRDYGLALADVGQYQRALDTMYSIFNRSFSEGTASRDQGIEEILVTEINNLISLHGDKLDLSRIDKKMIFKMPVDVRVVINWNKNDTDIDLWVTDPNGERCYYGNASTALGGRISNDFTQGFGPEQFMLKKAEKGRYKIEVNYYGENQVSLSGATTIMAEIYTRYSDGQQQRKIITIQMPRESKEGVLIGTFSF